MKTSFKMIVAAVAFAAFTVTTYAGLFDTLNSLTKSTDATTVSTGSLSQDQMIGGLKEALSKGVEHAVATLGHNDGFLTNLSVKIPMPEKLQTAEKTLRALGQNQMADDFVGSMNHAAEKAVPEAAAVFGDAIKQMSITDAQAILTGPDDSATQYFRKTTQTNLFARFYPIVQKVTEQVGVTAQYKQMMSKVSGAESLGGLFGGRAQTGLQAAISTLTLRTKPWTACSKWWLTRRKASVKIRLPARVTCCKKSLVPSQSEATSGFIFSNSRRFRHWCRAEALAQSFLSRVN